jgi:hypothetical protein
MKWSVIIRSAIIYIVLCISEQSVAQSNTSPIEYPGYNRYWYFGVNAGLDFGTDYSLSLMNAVISSNTSNEFEGTSVLSNNHGDLIACSMGYNFYDRNFNLVPGAVGLGSSTSSHQGSIFVPNPKTDKPCEFYLFGVMSQSKESTKWRRLTWNKFKVQADLSITPMLVRQPAELNPPDATYTSSNELIHAFRSPVNDGRNRTFIITTRNGFDTIHGGTIGDYKKFIIGYVDKDTEAPQFYGLDSENPNNDLSYFNSNNTWAIKVSPNGKKLVMNCSYSGGWGFFLFDIDYDNNTGLINAIIFKKFVLLSSHCDAMDFDRSSRFVYMATRGVGSKTVKWKDARVYQYDTEGDGLLQEMFSTNDININEPPTFPSQYVLGMVVKRPGDNDDMIVNFNDHNTLGRIVNSHLAYDETDPTNGAQYLHEDILLANGATSRIGLPNQLYYGADFKCPECNVQCCPTIVSSGNTAGGGAISNDAILRNMFIVDRIGNSNTYHFRLNNSAALYRYISEYVSLIQRDYCNEISSFEINWRAYKESDNTVLSYNNNGNVLTSVKSIFVPSSMSYTNDPNVALLPYTFEFDTAYKIELEFSGISGGLVITFPNCPKNYFTIKNIKP